MKANLGTIDRTIRVLIALVVIVLYFTGHISGAAAIILLILAGIFIATSFMGYWPVYHLCGLSSKEKPVK